MTENRHMRRRTGWERRRFRASARFGVAQLLMVVLGFVALALQSFVVQTHIHIPQASIRAQSASFITLIAGSAGVSDVGPGQSNTPSDQYPISRDPANCPLCKELTHSGQYVSSASVLATLPFPVTVNFIVFKEIAPSRFAASHNWRGRAPPIA
jgi:hypothetical protein